MNIQYVHNVAYFVYIMDICIICSTVLQYVHIVRLMYIDNVHTVVKRSEHVAKLMTIWGP